MTTTMLGRQASILVIQSVDYQHSGTYTCRAENPAGITAHSAQLRVNGKLKERHWYILFTEKPEIVPFSFGYETIDQGKLAQLTCVISSGDMPLTITWSLKGDLISSDPTMTTTMIGRQMSMLLIQSVDYQHSGIYTCRAENPAGISTYSAELRVNGKPKDGHWSILFTEKPEIVPFDFGGESVNEGESVMIMCNIRRGDKPYVVTWHLKGDIISSDPDLTTTMLGTQASLLTINNVGFRHSGSYTCRAENYAGVSTYSAQLRVNGKHTSGEGTGNNTYFMFWWGIEELKGTLYHALCLLSRKFVWQTV